MPDRKQDAGKAKALLAEAGYPEGLKVTVAGRVGHEKILQVIQSQARKAGIEMTILIRDNPSHLSAMTNADFEISMSGGTTGPDPDLAYYGYYHTPSPERWGKGGRTEPCYSNARVDRLLEEARRISDLQPRRRMYREVVEVLQEEVADLPIAFVPNGFAFQNYVRDFEPTTTEVYSYGNGGMLKTWIDR